MNVIFLSTRANKPASDFIDGSRDDLESGMGPREEALQEFKVLLQGLKAGHRFTKSDELQKRENKYNINKGSTVSTVLTHHCDDQCCTRMWLNADLFNNRIHMDAKYSVMRRQKF